MKKTKIICTMGPNTNDRNVMKALAENGMDIARFNFSHGDYEEHKMRLDMLKSIREETGLPIAAVLDTKGPEIRTGLLKDGKKVTLTEGQTFTLTTREIVGDSQMVYINYDGLNSDVTAGNRILIDDGLIELLVQEVNGTDIVCKVVNGGELGEKKGVNVPNVKIKLPALTEKDKADIQFGIEQGFDFIAASFVRSKEDVLQIREILKEHNSKIQIISKIESLQGIQNLEEIIEVSDGIMVARGDMGVEIPMEEVPIIQKRIIKLTTAAGKNVITATQMLDSMMKHPRPTRAEATDVANAIYDGTTGIMLSGETANGDYPLEAVQTMVRIAERAEKDIDYVGRLQKTGARLPQEQDTTTSICHATCTVATDLNAAAIIPVSMSGFTSGMVARFKPNCPIIACTTSRLVWRQMNLQWGVTPLLIAEENTAEDLFREAVKAAENAGLIKKGDKVVLTAGMPLGIPGRTNMLRVVEV